MMRRMRRRSFTLTLHTFPSYHSRCVTSQPPSFLCLSLTPIFRVSKQKSSTPSKLALGIIVTFPSFFRTRYRISLNHTFLFRLSAQDQAPYGTFLSRFKPLVVKSEAQHAALHRCRARRDGTVEMCCRFEAPAVATWSGCPGVQALAVEGMLEGLEH